MKRTNNHILEFFEEWAPQSSKLEYDNVGLLIGDKHQNIGKIITCLEVTSEVVEEAIAEKADLIVAHHPLIFRKLSRVTPSDTTGSLIYRLIKQDISLIAAHTNLDAAYGGVSFVMAERLELHNVRFLKEAPQNGNTDSPHNDAGFGALGELPEALNTSELLSLISEKLDSRGIRYSGTPDAIKKVAVCGGAGSFLIDEAQRQEADAYITADLKYHDFFTESPTMLLVDAGHYESEVSITETLRDRLKDRFPDLDVFSTNMNTNPVKYYYQ